MKFRATRTDALQRLSDFAPKSGRDYAAGRNYDLPDHRHVSTLSPYIRHRVVTEAEVLKATLSRYSHATAEKFIQEVFWRTYWKGWLELRPSVWMDYRAEVKAGLNRVKSEEGLRAEFEAACRGETEIECFNHWSQQLVENGYLHNHARMWFASIWIFTLRLPWALGADFFLRHLLDGDPASNTLSWRWVAGLQTRGKTYLARPANIAKYTEGRFRPDAHQLAAHAAPLDGPPLPERGQAPAGDVFAANGKTGLLLHEDDLSPSFLPQAALTCGTAALLLTTCDRSPLAVGHGVLQFATDATQDMVERNGQQLGQITPFETGKAAIPDLVTWATDNKLTQIVTPFAPQGATCEALDQLQYRLKDHNITLTRVMRDYDALAWPHATAGFFKFKDKIPKLIDQLSLAPTA